MASELFVRKRIVCREFCNGLHLRTHAELAFGILDMKRDRAFRDADQLRRFPRRFSSGGEAQAFQLSRRERGSEKGRAQRGFPQIDFPARACDLAQARRGGTSPFSNEGSSYQRKEWPQSSSGQRRSQAARQYQEVGILIRTIVLWIGGKVKWEPFC